MRRPVTPGLLAIRAVNQYRRRDVLPYLALRYYLDADNARADKWVRNVSTDLVLTRSNLPYHETKHFKEVSANGIIHRTLHLPCANEALAEAHLLSRCSEREGLRLPPTVFSYELSAEPRQREGIFRHYFHGLQRRQRWIATTLGNGPDQIVQFTDIKRFYPSISSERAITAWKRHAEAAGLHHKDIQLGERLLADHKKVACPNEGGVLTGPMFSHFIGNLVLRDFDQHFEQQLPAAYGRYVDDIVLVGSRRQVGKSLDAVRSALIDNGFELHGEESDKHLAVPGPEWMASRNDFVEQHPHVSWMSFVGDLKRYLLVEPDASNELRARFSASGFRVPTLDYSNAVRERSSLERILQLAKFLPWFRVKTGMIDADGLLNAAERLRQRYQSEFDHLLMEATNSEGFNRKRLLTKLRYRAGRLAHLGDPGRLCDFARQLEAVPELVLHSRILDALGRSELDSILPMGSNAAHSVAQVARAGGLRMTLERPPSEPPAMDSLAVVLLNGVDVDTPRIQADHELQRFAVQGSDRALMLSNQPFIREISCLHGLSQRPRHADFLETAFDEDEDLSIDAINQLQQSASM